MRGNRDAEPSSSYDERHCRQGTVVEDWKDAVVVPISKGDLRLCDNRHGISPLDVVGKVLEHIVQERL